MFICLKKKTHDHFSIFPPCPCSQQEMGNIQQPPCLLSILNKTGNKFTQQTFLDLLLSGKSVKKTALHTREISNIGKVEGQIICSLFLNAISWSMHDHGKKKGAREKKVSEDNCVWLLANRPATHIIWKACGNRTCCFLWAGLGNTWQMMLRPVCRRLLRRGVCRLCASTVCNQNHDHFCLLF